MPIIGLDRMPIECFVGEDCPDLMKAFSFSLIFLSAVSLTTLQAQTNAVVFPQLLSVSNHVLMTNAEFRCIVGSKVFFQNRDDEHGFEAESLDTNVLATLGLTLEGLKDAQAKLDAKNHMAAAQYQQWLANRAQQEKQAAAEAAANAASATDGPANSSTNATAGANSPKPAHKHKPHLVAGG